MTENEIKTRLEAARRLHEIARRERLMGNVEYAADGALEACDRLITIIEGQARRIEQLERENAPKDFREPKGVKAGCMDV